ncbi:MAG TPA: DUF397 domain-containing protein [Actinokineospora sp.]|nr:DUF397 domain-containing protein [Actinokineospora sp.]
MYGEWRKSSFSSGTKADCVEVAYRTTVRLRDSKSPDAGTLTIPASTWSPDRMVVACPQPQAR